jgi:hypothetical protein
MEGGLGGWKQEMRSLRSGFWRYPGPFEISDSKFRIQRAILNARRGWKVAKANTIPTECNQTRPDFNRTLSRTDYVGSDVLIKPQSGGGCVQLLRR